MNKKAHQEFKTKELPNEPFLMEVRKLIAEGHKVTIRVRGFSMRPFLEDRRDKIVLTKVNTPKVGEAVLAEIAPGHYVFHRIIDITNDKVTLRGDGNVQGVEHCLLKDVAATADSFIRKNKTYAANGKTWKRYSKIWLRLSPMRRYLLAIYRRLPQRWR